MSARVLIGSLRRRVTIEAPLDVPDEFGGFARSFAPLAQVWAKIETLSTSDQFVEQRL